MRFVLDVRRELERDRAFGHRARSWVVSALVASAISTTGCPRAMNAERRERASAPPPATAHVAPDASVSEPSVAPVRELPDVSTDWCDGEGWRGLSEGVCYFVPPSFKPVHGEDTATNHLLIYLPGVIPPVPKSPQKEKVQRIVAAAAARAHAFALLPRGRRGIGPGSAKDWWAWPTSGADYATYASSLTSEWATARAKLEAALGEVHFDHVYLAGSSSGAYFLSALALAHAIEGIDGFAATSGGAPGLLGAPRPSSDKVPFYVGYAAGDPSNGGPKALAAFLSAHGWPVRVKEHPGGHGAREEYLDEAFDLWSQSSH